MAKQKKQVDPLRALEEIGNIFVDYLDDDNALCTEQIKDRPEYQIIKKALEEHAEEKQLLAVLKDTLKGHIEPLALNDRDDDTLRYEIRVYPDADDDWGIIYQDATKEQYEMVARWIQ